MADIGRQIGAGRESLAEVHWHWLTWGSALHTEEVTGSIPVSPTVKTPGHRLNEPDVTRGFVVPGCAACRTARLSLLLGEQTARADPVEGRTAVGQQGSLSAARFVLVRRPARQTCP